MYRKLTILFFVVLSVAATGATAEQYFHVAAHNPGVNDTMWLTDAQIFNPDCRRHHRGSARLSRPRPSQHRSRRVHGQYRASTGPCC